MTTPTDHERELARQLAAQIAGVKIEHITEAPRWCGDGYDGACLAGDCDILGSVEIIATALAEATAAQRDLLRHLVYSNHGYEPDGCVLCGDIAHAIRAQERG